MLRRLLPFCITPPQDEHHHEDCLDLLGEWQKVYKKYWIHEKLGWLELGAHVKYVLTCNFGFGEDDDGVEDEGGGSFIVNSWSFSVSKDMRVE
ncbi:hypothetical protein Tco_0405522 [Tanacetum coccineum]